jgi:predicted enzyme related to lactoylglutathione lyase
VIPPRISGLFEVSTRVGWVRQWYEGLGWRSERLDDVFVSYPINEGMSFALWSLGSAAPNVAAVVAAAGGFSGALLCIVVDFAAEVGAILGEVEDAGGRVVVADHQVPFGRSGWFLDPAGAAWEVAWIEGRASAEPFAGTTLPDALPVSLVGAVMGVDDPAGLEKFYADGFGWVDRRRQFAGGPALALDGGTLAFAPASWVPGGLESGPIPMVRPVSPAGVDYVVEQFVRLGAFRVVLPDDPERPALGAWVVDPFGLYWHIVPEL